MHEDLVGLDPAGARRAVQALADAQAALDGASRRVQALLDEAGQGESCTAPATIRRAALSCRAIATDLDRRIGLLGQPDLRSRLWRLGPLPGPCTTQPGVLPPPATGSTSAIVVPGPTVLITPPARAPRVVYTTVGGHPCGSTVYTTGRREGVGQPVKPPSTLPGFPDAVRVPPKTPKQGGGNLRKRWRGPDGTIYEWDSQHGTVEVYNKKGTRHLGEYDPHTGDKVKPPNPTRRVET